MISGKKIVVVMPAYNAEKTLRQTWAFRTDISMTPPRSTSPVASSTDSAFWRHL
jgi:hypothetical protein